MPNASGNAEVQRLMRDAGRNVAMDYGCGGSSADGSLVPTALKGGYLWYPFSVPGYGFTSADRSSYGVSSYITVVNNLTHRWPVLLEGCASRKKGWLFFWKYSTCHEWVCDGYNQTSNRCYGYLQFHMNWGWHEQGLTNDHNGWFAFNNWYIPGRNLNFQYGQDFTYNIHP
ncbi:MAG: C10 family peptidase [Chitinophagaceae bacterium]|nr:C10 family peptidase [Chitinophagaceae bacterium]